MIDFKGNTAYPDSFWPVSNPGDEGLDPVLLREALDNIGSRGLEIHSIVIRNGRIVFEHYGNDSQNGGRQWTPAGLHGLYSTSKTFTSALTGCAIADGFLPGADARVMDYFRDDGILNDSEDKEKITLEDLLTMRSGLKYIEDGFASVFLDIYNCAAAFLSRPVEKTPGSFWNYSSADTQILGEILRRVTGRTPLEYAREKIFSPLGIDDTGWIAGANGTQFCGWGLFLRPRDLARFGYLYMNRGKWKGRELVPEEWVDISTKSHTATPWAGDYGFQCWIPPIGGFATRGFMGQEMYMFPDRDLIAVFTAALPKESADITLDGIVKNYILKAVR